MKAHTALLAVLIQCAVVPCFSQTQPSPGGTPQTGENQPEITYHLSVMLPQYRFIDTSGYGGRVGEYDTLQQSLGGDLSLNFVNEPPRLTLRSTVDVITRDDYDVGAIQRIESVILHPIDL